MKAIFAFAAVLLLQAAAPQGAPSPRPDWDWPLSPKPAVLRAFDPPEKPWMSGHRGVDLEATHDGDAVTSPASGTVSFVGVVVDRPVITIDHGGGLRSSFEPVESPLAKGAAVAKGQVIGALQAGHCGATDCVHWGVRREDNYINPLQFVTDLRPSILLPVSGAHPVSGAELVSRTHPVSGAELVSRTHPVSGAELVSRAEPVSGAELVRRPPSRQGGVDTVTGIHPRILDDG